MSLDEMLLTNYFSILKKSHDEGEVDMSVLMNPTVYELENLYEQFLDFIMESAKSKVIEGAEDTIDFDPDELTEKLLKKENELFATTIKKALFYMFFKPTDDNAQTISYIYSHSIDDLSRDFRFSSKMGFKIFLEYLRYLVLSEAGEINIEDEMGILKREPWIRKMSSHRGFFTINEMGRDVLGSIFDFLFASYVDKEKIFGEIDDFFKSKTLDPTIEKFGPPIQSEDELEAFKFVLMRIIVADSYLYLKALNYDEVALEDGEDYSDILDELEGRILEGNYTLPTKKSLRYNLYCAFYELLKKDFLREYYSNIFLANEDSKIIGSVNPLYFLD